MVVELAAMHWEQVVVHHWQLEQLQVQSKSHIKELESGCSACSSMTPLELMGKGDDLQAFSDFFQATAERPEKK